MFLTGLMAVDIKAFGRMENSTERAFYLQSKEKERKEYGKMVQKLQIKSRIYSENIYMFKLIRIKLIKDLIKLIGN